MSKREKGVKVEDPLLAQAFTFYNYSEAGISVGIDDVPNLVVLDLLEQIQQAGNKLKKKKLDGMENKHNGF